MDYSYFGIKKSIYLLTTLKNNKLFYFLLLMCMIPSCIPGYRLVEFEVLEPAMKNMPDGVKQVLILNRLPTSSYFLDSTSRSGLNQKQLVVLDTLIGKSIFEGMNSVLRISPIQSYWWPIWSDNRQSELHSSGDMKLTKREVADHCNVNYTDAIISLEFCFVDIKFEGYIYPATIPVTKSYLVAFTSSWVIYHPGYPKPVHEYHIKDTLYYETKLKAVQYTEMIRDASFRSGVKAGAVVSPVWIKSQRNVFSAGNHKLSKAAWYTEQGDWEEALDIWKEVSEHGSRRAAARALNNMAVYFELEDNLDSASYYIDMALASDSLELIKSYQRTIESRRLKKLRIFEQLTF